MTTTVAGLAATSVVPAGQIGRHRHVMRPGLEAGDVEIHDELGARQSVEVGGRAADRHEHPVGRTRRRSARCCAPSSWSPAVNVRVPVTGRIVIVTLMLSSPTWTTPVGRASVVVTVSSSETPVIGIGAVSTLASWASVVGVTGDKDDLRFDGRLMSISNPAAGDPVMIGLTGHRPCSDGRRRPGS